MQTTWDGHPDAAALIDRIIADLLDCCPPAAALSARMRAAGLRLVDWLDHIALSASDPRWSELAAVGFVEVGSRHAHPSARLPPLTQAARPALALRVQTLERCLTVLAPRARVDEPIGSPLRQATIAEAAAALLAVERHAGWDPPPADPSLIARAARHAAAFASRARDGDEDADMAVLDALATAAVAELGAAWASDLFFAAERERWLSGCDAGRVYDAEIAALGLDLGVADHHTFRSSRRWFARLIAVLEHLGMRCRERFHAGAEAGWGAQVLEHPETGAVVFADVDLAPQEVAVDFPHSGLPDRGRLGTVGLWCALHGEAILGAGLHHLAVPCVHDDLAARLAQRGTRTMPPFSDLPVLKQCFTAAEPRRVAPERLRRARERGWIDNAQAERFSAAGVLCAHLELAERRQGFKGFNQSAVSHIIRGTDPRRDPHG